MSRARPSLRAPAPDEPLDGFPVFHLQPSRALFRVVRDGHGPWWFGSSLRGRFDLPAPDGTCYLASDDVGALLEVLGPHLLPGGCAPARLLEGRHLRELRVPRRHRLANTLADKAARWVTAELSTLTPYELPQAWARTFRARGLDGVRYAPRHTPSRRRYSVALFGPAGERRSWRKSRPLRIDGTLLERLRRRTGVTVFDIPSEDQLRFG